MPLDVTDYARKLITCRSVTPEEGGALDLLQGTLEGLGFVCQRLPFSQEGTETVDNLYARLGEVSPNFCFAGHTDVVPPGDESAWCVPPFTPEVVDGILYGRGTVDMKGAIACFVSAVSQFLEEGKKPSGSISFLITADEEGPAINGTRKVVQWLQERGEVIDDCIVGEPTNPTQLGEMIKIGRRGSVTFRLRVTGEQGHVAYPESANNPVPVLVRILHRLQARVLDKGTDHFDPSNLEVTSVDVGNPTENLIPAEARAAFNIRFNDTHTSAELMDWVEGICREEAEAANVECFLTPRVTGEAFLTQPGRLSEIVSQAVEEVTGKVSQLSTTGGTSDARFIKDIANVVECGLINRTAHKVDECIAVADLEDLTAIYRQVLEGYFSFTPGSAS